MLHNKGLFTQYIRILWSGYIYMWLFWSFRLSWTDLRKTAHPLLFLVAHIGCSGGRSCFVVVLWLGLMYPRLAYHSPSSWGRHWVLAFLPLASWVGHALFQTGAFCAPSGSNLPSFTLLFSPELALFGLTSIHPQNRELFLKFYSTHKYSCKYPDKNQGVEQGPPALCWADTQGGGRSRGHQALFRWTFLVLWGLSASTSLPTPLPASLPRAFTAPNSPTASNTENST